MFFIDYSKDILYLVLAFCVLWITFFITWFIYYLVSAARQLHKASQAIKQQVDEVANVIKKIRLAIELPASIISLAIDGFKKIAEMGLEAMNKSRAEKKTRGSKKA